MTEIEFRAFLIRQRRKPSAIDQIMEYLGAYQEFVSEFYPTRTADQTNTEMLESYVFWHESETGESASKPLWAIRYYFDFIADKELSDLAGQLRSERIKRKPFYIRKFRDVNLEHVAQLESIYIENIDQLIDAARTPRLRQELADQTGLPMAGLLELIKLCDLARLGGVRTVRARLYYDAGLTPELIATWEPEALHQMLVDWVAQNNFDGIAPTPKEVQNLVEDAQKLPKLVIY